MSFDVPVYLSVLTCVLLACVAGLLLVVAQQVRALRREAGKLPVLQDDMGRFLMTARQGVEELKTKLVAVGPQLESQVSDADKRVTELELLLDRAEKVAAKLEQGIDVGRPATVVGVTPVPAVEVVVANGAAAREPKDTIIEKDPLEDLLAGLKEARAGVARALEEGGVQNALFESAEILPLREPVKTKVVSRSEESLRAKVRKKSA